MQDIEYQDFIFRIKNEFSILQTQLNPNAFEKVRAETGIKNINVLDELAITTKTLNYSKFEEY